MKIFDYSKLVLTKSGTLVGKLNTGIRITKPTNSTNCPTVYLNNLGEQKPSDGQEYTVLGGSKKVPIMMKEGSFYCKAGTFEGDKAFLGVRIYLGSSDMSNNVLYKDIPYSEGVLDDNGNLVFTYDYPVFETGKMYDYFHATYNTDSGEGEQFIQKAYMTVRHTNVKVPIPPEPEPVDPIEEYTVYGVNFDHSRGTSDPETYNVYWYSCGEDWFDENCQYEIVVKHGETIIDSALESYEAYNTSFNIGSDYLDNEKYTFEVRVVKADKKSLAGTVTDTYRDPFHDENIKIRESYLSIPVVGDTTGYTLSWFAPGAVKYEVYLNDDLYKTTTSSTISISDKDPGYYNITIKAYNYKNTEIILEDSITLADPMDYVYFDENSISIDYDDDTDKISISGVDLYCTSDDGDRVVIPSYVKNRLNDKSLKIYIDDSLVKEIRYDATIPDIDVSDLDVGMQHNCKFELVPIYNTYSIPKTSDIGFEKTACAIKECTFTPFADYIEMTDLVVVGVTTDNDDIVEEDPISVTITSVPGTADEYDAGTFSFNCDEFREYLKNHPGSIDLNNIEITIEITCEHGRTETLKTYVRIPSVSIDLDINSTYVDESNDYILQIQPVMTIEPAGVLNNISSDEVNVYIDNMKVITSTVYDCYNGYEIEVDTNGISNGTHTVKLEYVNDIYGTFTDTGSFELNRCEIESASISVDGDYDSDSKSVTINYTIDTDESVDVTITNNNTGSSETSSSTSDTITFYEDSLEKGTYNEFTVTVNCEHYNERTEYCSVDVPEEESEEY